MNGIIANRPQIKRAISIAADDFLSGGRYHRISDPRQAQLLVTVMGLDINLLAIDYPEVASDKGRSTSGIIAILAKALSYAYKEMEFNVIHDLIINNARAWSGFSRLHRPFRDKTGLESKILALL